MYFLFSVIFLWDGECLVFVWGVIGFFGLGYLFGGGEVFVVVLFFRGFGGWWLGNCVFDSCCVSVNMMVENDGFILSFFFVELFRGM